METREVAKEIADSFNPILFKNRGDYNHLIERIESALSRTRQETRAEVIEEIANDIIKSLRELNKESGKGEI